MKMKILMGAAVGLALCFAGCNGGDDGTENQLVPLVKNVEYNVTIANYRYTENNPVEMSAGWYRENILPGERLAYLELLLEKAKMGELKLSTMDGKAVDSTQIDALFYSNDTVTLARPYPPYDEYDTVMRVEKAKVENILALRFKEEWTYDATSLEIHKKVLAIAPVIMKVTMDENYNEVIDWTGTPAFWVNFEDGALPTYTLTHRIMYGIDFKFDSSPFNKNVDSVAIDKYFEAMIKRISEDSIPCYTWGGGHFSDSLLPYGEAVKMFQKKTPINGDTTVVEDAPVIGHIRFLEEWTFDYTTMAINKKVVGICPVRQRFDEDGLFMGYHPLFWVYFSDIWMPYDKKLVLKK